ncbi:hypothetical protein [Tenacibaculum sp. Bg11-29]|uniref:hypothetical protein n=1 Tax=Tenacibaculum sp. Bg11-29 TaxID=2058306 RepID=UPI0012FF0180|nr:hypothetical protein [Tenacibaculum sp. Bg11-29]
MPLIDDDEFLKMCNELDRLKENEKDLKKGYIDLKLENIKVNNYRKYKSLMILILTITILLLTLYVFKKKSGFTVILEQKNQLERLIDSINNNKALITESIEKEENQNIVIFAVQIGHFKDFNIPEERTDLKGGLRKLPKEIYKGGEKYIAGEFYTYNDAKILRDEIRRIGIKDAFIVALYKEKRIPIRNALKLLDN